MDIAVTRPKPEPKPTDRHMRRLDRQIAAFARIAPFGARLQSISKRGGARYRIPLALFLILGGLLSVLPFLGLWMLPVGLVLLAVDLPRLRPLVSSAIVRARRWWSVRRRRFRGGGPDRLG